MQICLEHKKWNAVCKLPKMLNKSKGREKIKMIDPVEKILGKKGKREKEDDDSYTERAAEYIYESD